MSVKLSIIAAMKQIAEKQQVKLPPLADDLSLHETGFDFARLPGGRGVASDGRRFRPGLRKCPRVRCLRSATISVRSKEDARSPTPRHVVSLTDILSQSCLGGRVAELSGRSVLLSASGQLISALAMIELDGIARRMLLCPPDLNPDHIQDLIEDAGIEAIVTDEPLRWSDAGVYLIVGAHLPRGRSGAAQDRTRHRMADADLGYLGRAEDRRLHAGRSLRRDRRRRSGARRAPSLGDLL